MDDAASKPTVTIKKYANRRLYNTATSSYVTLEHLSSMVKEGVEFNVYDAKTGEDITRSVLTQIIVEEEGKAGQNLLPIGFLRQLIGFYGDNMQWLVPKYLEHSMQMLAKNQEQIRGYFQSAFGGMFPFGSTFEEMGKQNLAMFERAMRLFSPFAGMTEDGNTSGRPQPVPVPEPEEEAYEPPHVAPSPPPPAAAAPSSSPLPPAATPKPSPVKTSSASHSSSHSSSYVPPSSVSPSQIARNVTPLASSEDSMSDQEVQKKISALQRQLADLAKSKA